MLKQNKPGIPSGTRDFGPDVVRKRQFIFQTIRRVFELYGFQPLETPSMENLETLMGKYGEEGDKLIFKILNNGLHEKKDQELIRQEFSKILEGKNSKAITEKALRYDLTIPFARYVAMNYGQLAMPFRRYQIQPVWRADRPQKGRYREFYQCDADVVGSYSLLNEVDLAYIYHEVFSQLGMNGYELRINSRKILTALAEICGGPEKMMDITIAIDKLDKIGMDKVKEELAQRGLDQKQVTIIEDYLNINGSNEEKLKSVRELFRENDNGRKGIGELEFVLERTFEAAGGELRASGGGSTSNEKQKTINLTIDFTLARGLNYYTGIIFEAKAPQEVKIGSIGGGGRYDDLTGLFGVPGVPGVGISFGVDRIYDVLEELNLFPAAVEEGTRILFFNLGDAESREAYRVMQRLRQKGIASEIYHEQAKFDRQFKYAEKKNIPFIGIIGSAELADNACTIKDLRSGEQKRVSLANVTDFLFF